MAASNRPKKKKEEGSELPSWFNEVAGIVLCGLGVLLFMAMVTLVLQSVIGLIANRYQRNKDK